MTRRLFLLVFTISLAVGAAACGGDDDDEAAAEPTAEETTTHERDNRGRRGLAYHAHGRSRRGHLLRHDRAHGRCRRRHHRARQRLRHPAQRRGRGERGRGGQRHDHVGHHRAHDDPRARRVRVLLRGPGAPRRRHGGDADRRVAFPAWSSSISSTSAGGTSSARTCSRVTSLPSSTAGPRAALRPAHVARAARARDRDLRHLVLAHPPRPCGRCRLTGA